MLPSTNIQSIVGATLFGPDDEKIGRISQVFVDAGDGHPTWAEVNLGALTRHPAFVPLHEATWEHDDVFVPYRKQTVKSAPRTDAAGGLDPAQEDELNRHYAGEPPVEAADATPQRSDRSDDSTARDRRPDDGDDDRRDDDRDRDGDGIDDRAAHESRARPDATTEPDRQLDDDGVLWEEQVVVKKQKVPVAKVHLEKTTVTEQRDVTADVQKERVALEQENTGDTGSPVSPPRHGRDDTAR
jgi:hypothetical protein